MKGLADDAIVDDLRDAFVTQHEPDVKRPAAVEVRAGEDGDKLKAGAELTGYFELPGTSTVVPGPGQSEDTALVLTLPPQQQQQQQQAGNAALDSVVIAGEIMRWMKQSDGPTKTPPTRGREELEKLRFAQSVTQVTLNNNLPPILTTDALNQLHEDLTASAQFSPKISSAEAALTALLTPSVAALVGEVAEETKSGLVLSNTESIPWLPPTEISPKGDWKKPDLLTAHPAVLISQESNGGDGIVSFRNSRNDWVAADRLFGGVEPKNISIGFVSSLWEGKCELGDMHGALGEMVDYVACAVIKK